MSEADPDQEAEAVDLVEVGMCNQCGYVESDGEFPFEYGPRCPNAGCGRVLKVAWNLPRSDTDRYGSSEE